MTEADRSVSVSTSNDQTPARWMCVSTEGNPTGDYCGFLEVYVPGSLQTHFIVWWNPDQTYNGGETDWEDFPRWRSITHWRRLTDPTSSVETKPPLGYEDIEGELERVTARLTSVWNNCRVVFYPPMDDPRGNYPLEHAPRAHKDMRAVIEHRLSELAGPAQKASPPYSSHWQCPCCQSWYTCERLVCPVSGDSRPAENGRVKA